MLKSHLAALSLILCCAAYALPAHPRLLVTEADWKKLPARMEEDAAVREAIRATVARADSVLDAPPLTRTLTGRRLLQVSRDALQRVLDLGTAWKVTGERRYFERCREEMLNVCLFEDWHPVHHLDTAEMQTAVAIGYDWLYGDLSPEDRKTLETALLEKGLKETFRSKSLQRTKNNWNQVCMGGMVLSAIALMDIEPELCKMALDEARAPIQVGLKSSYPADGAYAEGGGYWQYGTEYAILIVEALRSAGLPDAGIVSHPGFLESGYYVAQVYGTSGLLFNYGDNGESPLGANMAGAWMARETRSTQLRNFFRPPFLEMSGKRQGRLHALTAFWLPGTADAKADTLPPHFLGAGHSPVALQRTGYGKDDLFLGIKAGKADVPHGHMDAGSFVIDWRGERWATDLGSQNYHSLEEKGIALFEMTQGSRRWKVFRLNNFTHNTLTYNGRLHDIDGAAKIVSSKGEPEHETLLDMAAPLGLPVGATATRRFKMVDESVAVTDTLEGLKPGDKITWHVITRAKATQRKDGFELSLGGKRMMLDLSSPQSVSAKAAPADPPTTDYDAPNPGMTRIFLEAVAGEDGKVTINSAFRGAE
jgi:oligo-alginate lyase